jgi:hypothetical protein
MAISKKAWNKVKDKVNLDDTVVHEDEDIALWIAGMGMKIIQANNVRVTSYNQSFRYLPKLLYYIRLRNKTKKYHILQNNLPAPEIIRIPMLKRVGSHLLSIPALVYGLVFGLIMLPLDLFMVKVVKDKNWFD